MSMIVLRPSGNGITACHFDFYNGQQTLYLACNDWYALVKSATTLQYSCFCIWMFGQLDILHNPTTSLSDLLIVTNQGIVLYEINLRDECLDMMVWSSFVIVLLCHCLSTTHT